MDTRGKFSLNLPHGAGTLQVVEGVWDASCTASKYAHDAKEEIIS